MRDTGVSGVLVGRGALRNPWIFSQAAAALAGGDIQPASLPERGRFLLEYIDLLLDENSGLEDEGFRHAGTDAARGRPRPAQGHR